jgi:hypothetical protein
MRFVATRHGGRENYDFYSVFFNFLDAVQNSEAPRYEVAARRST